MKTFGLAFMAALIAGFEFGFLEPSTFFGWIWLIGAVAYAVAAFVEFVRWVAD